jgi:hypothetical protein
LPKIVTVTVKGKGAEHSGRTVTYDSASVMGEGSIVLSVNPTSPPRQIVFYFDGLEDGDTLTVSTLGFNLSSASVFNPFRWTVIFLVALLICLVSKLGLRRHAYAEGDALSLSAKAVTVLLCLTLALTFVSLFGTEYKDIEYPLTDRVATYNPYIQQFDAFEKGQLHIDHKPSDKLTSLENPYDPANRVAGSYLWDRAFYNGHYYVYFGTAPIYTVYYPYYYATGALPPDCFVLGVFVVMTALFLPLAIFKFAALYLKKTPVSLVCLAAIAGFMATNALMLFRGDAGFYYIATLSGIGFFSLFIYLFMCALAKVSADAPEDKTARVLFYIKKYALLALAGAAYGGIFASRTSIAVIAAFFVVPAVICKILLKKRNGGLKVRLLGMGYELIALGLPVICIAGAVLAFNAARFGSPFEFGNTYQLTVSDISKNKLRISDLWPSFYHYFLQPLGSSPGYPFVGLSTQVLNYGHYVYVDPNFGLFNIPLAALSALTPVWLLDKRLPRYLKILGASVAVGLVTVAWMDFCLGGVIFRYIGDLTAPAALLGAGCLCLYGRPFRREG